MNHLQTLTISYECEASLGNSLDVKEMTKEFLRVFLKKTSALYGAIIQIKDAKCGSVLNSVGKNEFLNHIVSKRPDTIDKYAIIDIEKDGMLYNYLYIPLEGYCLTFIYSKNNLLEIEVVANIFYSLRKKIELGVKASLEHERIELALLGSNDGLWDWNLSDNTIYFSPRWKEMLGYSDDELSNELSTWQELVHPDDLEKAVLDIEENIAGKTDYYENIHRLEHKNGKWIWILDKGKTHFDKQGKAFRMIGTHTDITNEKEMQLKFVHQSQILEQIHDSVIYSDLDGIILGYNRGSQLLYGYKSDEIISKHISILSPIEDLESIKKHIALIKKHGKYHAELRLITKSKKIIFVNIIISPLRDEAGKIIGLVGCSHDITKRKKAEEKLQYQAYHDPLTGLPNRALFKDRLEQSMEKAKRNSGKIALFFIDLDYFKEINDSLGHEVGDKVLQVVTDRLQKIIRKEDTLARLGGDEFTIIMESLTQIEGASLLATKILKSLSKAIKIDSHTLHISSSIGISFYPQDAKKYSTLLSHADKAMYKAKDEGRNNYQFYDKILSR
ncbi:MAG: diguanylate cyclase [Campylobacterota bacterium]|nr:diguanylate cyclase [Campylobacterota bacterium]